MKRRNRQRRARTVPNNSTGSIVGPPAETLTGRCKTCGKETRAVRCKPCHKEFESWLSGPSEPEETPETYVPRHRFEDLPE